MLAYTYIKQGKFKLLRKPKRIIVCEKSPERIRFVREHYPDVWVVEPENCKDFVLRNSAHGGADVVLEVAGSGWRGSVPVLLLLLHTHRFPLNKIEEAYRVFENRLDGVIKVVISGDE